VSRWPDDPPRFAPPRRLGLIAALLMVVVFAVIGVFLSASYPPRCRRVDLAAPSAPYCAVIAPSATSTVPVTNDDSSEARKRAQLAISRGSPGRPIGWNESIVS